MKNWNWMCRDILDLPDSHPDSVAKDAARQHLRLQVSLTPDQGRPRTAEELEMIELMAYFDTVFGVKESEASAKRARLYHHQPASSSGSDD